MKKRDQVDLSLLQKRAEILRIQLEEIARSEPLANICLKGLQAMFVAIQDGKITAPYKQIPYGRYFYSEELSNYRNLTEAYSNFAVTATGYDDEEVRRSVAHIREQARSPKQ